MILAITMILLYRLQGSRLGRAWMAIREDELAAASSGHQHDHDQAAGLRPGRLDGRPGGRLRASKLTFVGPDQFGFQVSFTVLAMVVLGGMGNIWGVAIGAFIIYTIQACSSRSSTSSSRRSTCRSSRDIDFVQYQYLLYGIALVGMMLLRPEGLFPSSRRRATRSSTIGRSEDVAE